MRRIFICLLMVSFIFIGTSVYAGPGHGHSHGPTTPITKEQAEKTATKIVKTIVTKGTLDASWNDVEPASCEKKKIKDIQGWVVKFENPKEKDKEKQNLYVLLTLSGKYIAANHTGI